MSVDVDELEDAPAVGELRGALSAPALLEAWIGPEAGWRAIGPRLGTCVVQLRGRYVLTIGYDAGPVPGPVAP